MDQQIKNDLLEAFRSDPIFSEALHLKSDLDKSLKAQHHTLGGQRNQGATNGGDYWHYIGTPDEIAFKNSWANTGLGSQPARYRKDGAGRVWVEGVISGGASGSAAFTLPVAYQLSTVIYLPVIAAGGATPSYITFGGGGDMIPLVAGSAPKLASFSFSFIADE